MIRNALDSVFIRRYDALSRRNALERLRLLEHHDGHRLAPNLRRQADAYAREVLGSKAFAPWLYVYAKGRGEFVEAWIPDNFFVRVVIPNVNGVLRYVPTLKTFTSAVLDSTSIPDVAYVIDGRFYGAGYRPVGKDDVRDVLFSRGDEVVVKRDDSAGGRDVFFLRADGFVPDALLQDAPNAVVQWRVDHHPLFTELSGAEGSNLRLLTVRLPDDSLEVRHAALRFGTPNARIYGQGDGFHALVDHETGRFLERYITSDWRLIERIPDGSRSLGSGSIPGYEAACSTCLSLHAQVPHLGVIGWDVMIDAEEQPWVVEWNARHPAAYGGETFRGPLFKGVGWESLRPIRRTWLY